MHNNISILFRSYTRVFNVMRMRMKGTNECVPIARIMRVHCLLYIYTTKSTLLRDLPAAGALIESSHRK